MHLVGMRIFGSQVTSLLGLSVDDDIWEPGNSYAFSGMRIFGS